MPTIGRSLEPVALLTALLGALALPRAAHAGLTADGNQLWHQGVSGVPDSAEAGDQLAFALAAADFDHDGFLDLALGVPGEDFSGGLDDAGAVQVLFGSIDGLVTTGNQFLDQSVLDGDAREADDFFGTALAVGDFDDDTFADLVVGVPGEDDETGGFTDAGAVHIVPGSASGLDENGAVWLFQGSGGMLDQPEDGDRFGSVVAVGDFDGDGFDDLAVGIPDETLTAGAEGAVQVLYGGPAGLTTAGNQLWTQDSPGILDAAEGGDLFGAALASGDFDRDGFDDLAVGAPGEGIETETGALAAAGVVHVLFGSQDGLAATDNQLWSQGSPGMQGGLEAFDAFGSTLAAGDLDRDGFADLAVGAPEESLGSATAAGAVHVLFGGGSGLTATGNQLWTQDTPGVDDDAETDDRFGVALTIGDFNGDTSLDLAIGVEETLGAADFAGAVHVLYGRGAQGPRTDGIEFWSQNSPGVLDVSEDGDHFGDALAAGSFDGDSFDELAVGVPGEAITPSTPEAGAAAVLFGEMDDPFLFADGFESGDTSAWSEVM